MPSLDELMAEEEATRLAETRKEIAAEKVTWDALTPEQQEEAIAKTEAKFAKVPDSLDDESNEDDDCEHCGIPGCDFDCDGEYDD